MEQPYDGGDKRASSSLSLPTPEISFRGKISRSGLPDDVLGGGAVAVEFHALDFWAECEGQEAPSASSADGSD